MVKVKVSDVYITNDFRASNFIILVHQIFYVAYDTVCKGSKILIKRHLLDINQDALEDTCQFNNKPFMVLFSLVTCPIS